jgi:predicted dehydrogenase
LFTDPERVEPDWIERDLDAGKHVLVPASCKLPPGLLETWSGVALRRGAQLAVLNPDHFLPSRRLIRQQLDSGRLGNPGLVRLHRWEPGSQAGSANSGGNVGPASLPTPLVRDLELIWSWMGVSPNVVYAVAAPADAAPGPCLLVHLGFVGGGMAMLDYTDRLPAGDDYLSLSVIGSSGAAYADDHQNVQLVYRGGRPQAFRVEERSLQLAGMVQEFVDGLRANRSFAATVSRWSGALKLAGLVSQSLASRRAVGLQG